MAKKKSNIRQLEESSWLAQIIKDKMEIESDTNGITNILNALNLLYK